MYWKDVSPLIHFTFWGWPLSKRKTDRTHFKKKKKRLQELNHFQNNCHVKFMLTWRRNKTNQIDTNWMADIWRKNTGYWMYIICIKDFSGYSTEDSPICLVYPR